MEIRGIGITKLECPKDLIDKILNTCYETSSDILGFALFEDEGYWCWYGWLDIQGIIDDDYYPVDDSTIQISKEATTICNEFKEKLNKLLDCASELLEVIGDGILDMIIFIRHDSEITGEAGELGYIDNYTGEEIAGINSKGCRNIAVVLI